MAEFESRKGIGKHDTQIPQRLIAARVRIGIELEVIAGIVSLRVFRSNGTGHTGIQISGGLGLRELAEAEPGVIEATFVYFFEVAVTVTVISLLPACQ